MDPGRPGSFPSWLHDFTVFTMAHEGEARAVADGCPLLGGRHLCEQGHRGRASHADGQAQADPVSRRAKNWEDLRGYPLAIEHGYEKWNIYRRFICCKWWFSVAMLVYQRVYSRDWSSFVIFPVIYSHLISPSWKPRDSGDIYWEDCWEDDPEISRRCKEI